MLLLLSASAVANPLPDFPFVIVSEKLTKQVKPDFVEVRFSIIAYDESSELAMGKLDNTATKVVSLLNELDIPKTKLEFSSINKEAKRDRKEQNFDLAILGYDVRQQLTLKLSELTKYPSFMKKLIAIDGVVRANSVFQLLNANDVKDKLITELSDKAKLKADSLAKAQGRQVKSVYGITTKDNFGEALAWFSLQSNSNSKYMLSSGYRPSNFEMLVPEYIEVDQQITAIYKLK